MQQIMPFEYKGRQVRTIVREGETWWVLVDVCKILGLTSSARTAERLDKDEVSQAQVIDAMGRQQLTAVVNESGLYSVLLRSDKPEAKPFKRWVTHEVLPAIRRTGTYISPQMPAPVQSTRELVCDVPVNREAQKVIMEMKNLPGAISEVLYLYNGYYPEDKRKSYADVLTHLCSRLLCLSYDLNRVKYKEIEKP